MKIIAIGDIHGSNVWKRIVQQDADKIIFIGDYFDSPDPQISARMQIDNFNEIAALKKANPDKVILLVGNHDYHYLYNFERYSGYQPLAAFDIKEALQRARPYLQACSISEIEACKYLFSHAGITSKWAEINEIDLNDLENSVNDLFNFNPRAFAFTRGEKNDDTGDEICQTPIWVRPNSLLKDGIKNISPINFCRQIVGHTALKNKIYIQNNVSFINCLGNIPTDVNTDLTDYYFRTIL